MNDAIVQAVREHVKDRPRFYRVGDTLQIGNTPIVLTPELYEAVLYPLVDITALGE